MKLTGRPYSFLSQVRNNAKPCKEGLLRWIKTSER